MGAGNCSGTFPAGCCERGLEQFNAQRQMEKETMAAVSEVNRSSQAPAQGDDKVELNQGLENTVSS